MKSNIPHAPSPLRSNGWSGIRLLTLKSAGTNDPEGPDTNMKYNNTEH
jgi:hypothetical protein